MSSWDAEVLADGRLRAECGALDAALGRVQEAALFRSRQWALATLERRFAAALRLVFHRQRRELLNRLAAADRGDWGAAVDGALALTRPAMVAVLTRFASDGLRAGWRQSAAALDAGVAFDPASDDVAAHLAGLDDLATQIDAVTSERVLAIIGPSVSESAIPAEMRGRLRLLYDGFASVAGVADRALTIAGDVLHHAWEEGRRIVAGIVHATSAPVEKEWRILADDRTCRICAGNAGAGWIAADVAFPSGHQRPAAHPRCRCSVALRRGT